MKSAGSKRVLLVEDNFLVGSAIHAIVEETGAAVVGPLADADQALTAARTEQLDFAILDISIRGGTSVEVARTLRQRSCPFVFITGYSDADTLPEDLRSVPVITKPVDRDDLRLLLDCGLSDSGGRAAVLEA